MVDVDSNDIKRSDLLRLRSGAVVGVQWIKENIDRFTDSFDDTSDGEKYMDACSILDAGNTIIKLVDFLLEGKKIKD